MAGFVKINDQQCLLLTTREGASYVEEHKESDVARQALLSGGYLPYDERKLAFVFADFSGGDGYNTLSRRDVVQEISLGITHGESEASHQTKIDKGTVYGPEQSVTPNYTPAKTIVIGTTAFVHTTTGQLFARTTDISSLLSTNVDDIFQYNGKLYYIRHITGLKLYECDPETLSTHWWTVSGMTEINDAKWTQAGNVVYALQDGHIYILSFELLTGPIAAGIQSIRGGTCTISKFQRSLQTETQNLGLTEGKKGKYYRPLCDTKYATQDLFRLVPMSGNVPQTGSIQFKALAHTTFGVASGYFLNTATTPNLRTMSLAGFNKPTISGLVGIEVYQRKSTGSGSLIDIASQPESERPAAAEDGAMTGFVFFCQPVNRTFEVTIKGGNSPVRPCYNFFLGEEVAIDTVCPLIDSPEFALRFKGHIDLGDAIPIGASWYIPMLTSDVVAEGSYSLPQYVKITGLRDKNGKKAAHLPNFPSLTTDVVTGDTRIDFDPPTNPQREIQEQIDWQFDVGTRTLTFIDPINGGRMPVNADLEYDPYIAFGEPMLTLPPDTLTRRTITVCRRWPPGIKGKNVFQIHGNSENALFTEIPDTQWQAAADQPSALIEQHDTDFVLRDAYVGSIVKVLSWANRIVLATNFNGSGYVYVADRSGITEVANYQNRTIYDIGLLEDGLLVAHGNGGSAIITVPGGVDLRSFLGNWCQFCPAPLGLYCIYGDGALQITKDGICQPFGASDAIIGLIHSNTIYSLTGTETQMVQLVQRAQNVSLTTPPLEVATDPGTVKHIVGVVLDTSDNSQDATVAIVQDGVTTILDRSEGIYKPPSEYTTPMSNARIRIIATDVDLKKIIVIISIAQRTMTDLRSIAIDIGSEVVLEDGQLLTEPPTYTWLKTLLDSRQQVSFTDITNTTKRALIIACKLQGFPSARPTTANKTTESASWIVMLTLDMNPC
jgi:hypothetical protein